MIKYPASIDTSLEIPTVVDNVTPISGALLNNMRDAILAMENELGIKPSGIYTNVRTRIAALEVTVGNIVVGAVSFGGDLNAATISSQTVIGLQGRPVSAIMPDDGYALTWDNVDGYWKPAPSSSGSSAVGVVNTIQTTDGAGTLVGATDVKAGSGYLSIGTIPATIGSIRLSNTVNMIASRNAVDSADLVALATDASDNLYLGASSTGTTAHPQIVINPTSFGYLYVSGTPKLTWGASSIIASVPFVGDASPYGAHGVGTQPMADANQVPTSSIYCYNTIVTTGAITDNRNLTLPTTTDAAGYTKIIDNTCTGAFAVIVTTGAGVTATVNNGTKGIILIDSRGVTLVGAPTLPSRYELNLASGLFTTTSTTFTRTGSRQIDMSVFPTTIGALTRMVVFSADIDMTAGATSVEVQLYDITHSTVITSTDLTSSSTANTRVTSGALTVGSSAGNIRSDIATQYELQFKMNGGGGSDAVSLTNSRLVITYA